MEYNQKIIEKYYDFKNGIFLTEEGDSAMKEKFKEDLKASEKK